MHRDHQRVMPWRHFDRAASHEAACGEVGKNQLGNTLERGQAEDEFGRCHAACRSETQLAVKPGPSAVNSERAGNPLARARSRTTNTVGDAKLPKSRIPCR